MQCNAIQCNTEMHVCQSQAVAGMVKARMADAGARTRALQLPGRVDQFRKALGNGLDAVVDPL